ncbi:hypothetical protein MGG_17919 [Pyricularia oryzae 70-15]|uniref:Uncharacterized protein n=1 Tax=Pyricularia oryzae (strain 70-15 / ATCC MYA-4617 / FGSC 8958) TaxID=242507 RepID=G4NLI7_PYRO7|nr:uncharacterized protein MGG_17919 [Pyricularia oryzae 70-15]EHA46040.1 hypothetical protein MGG_17919 [Pyricularia oryzae 70-15]
MAWPPADSTKKKRLLVREAPHGHDRLCFPRLVGVVRVDKIGSWPGTRRCSRMRLRYLEPLTLCPA